MEEGFGIKGGSHRGLALRWGTIEASRYKSARFGSAIPGTLIRRQETGAGANVRPDHMQIIMQLGLKSPDRLNGDCQND